MPRPPDHVGSDALRFLVAGGLNTALTTLVYFAGLLVASPGVSYTIAWLVGLAFVMIFYPDRVFVGGDTSPKARLMLGVVVIGVYPDRARAAALARPADRRGKDRLPADAGGDNRAQFRGRPHAVASRLIRILFTVDNCVLTLAHNAPDATGS